MKRLLIPVIIMLLVSSGMAQPPDWEKGIPEERKERIKKRIETMRIWKLTEALGLDEGKAVVFFPRYKRFIEENENLKKSTIDISRAIEEGFKKGENVDYKAQYESLKKNVQLMQDQLFEFIDSNSDILDDRDKAALLVFEMRFDRALHGMLMDIWREEGAPPRRDGGKRYPGSGRKGP